MDTHSQPKPWNRPRNIIVAVILVVISVVAYQFFLAFTATPGTSVDYGLKMRELALSLKPDATEADNAFPLLARAMERRNAVLENLPATDPEFRRGDIDFSLLYTPFNPADPAATGNASGDLADYERRRGVTQRVLQLYEDTGVFDAMSEAVQRPVMARPKMEGPIIEVLLPDLGVYRDIARANVARMRLARTNKDSAKYVAAFEQSMGMGRLCTREPILICNLVGIAISALTLGELRDALLAGEFDAETIRALGAALDRQIAYEPAAFSFAGERLFFLDTVQWTHTDDGHGDGRRIIAESMKLQDWTGAAATAQPATPLVNLAHLLYPSKKQLAAKGEEFYTKTIEVSRLSIAQRRKTDWDGDAFISKLNWQYDMLKLLLPALSKANQSSDENAMELAGVRTMLAVEAYRAEHKAPPATLEELVPGYITRLPDDPYGTSGTFKYRVLPAPDSEGRVYILYSVGTNLQDDGGQDGPLAPNARPSSGADIIVNRPRN